METENKIMRIEWVCSDGDCCKNLFCGCRVELYVIGEVAIYVALWCLSPTSSTVVFLNTGALDPIGRMGFRLLEQFGSYTPIFLLETLDDSNKTKEHRLHALRFLVFYEELFLGKKQPLDSPSDKLASVLNRNLSDPEVKEAYKKALDYIPQR